MGMVWVARLADDAQTAEILANPNSAYDFINPEVEVCDNSTLDLDKEWHAIHHLLTGSGGAIDSPLSLIIGNFKQVGEDNGYGPAWYIPPGALRSFNDALSALDQTTLRHGYDPEAMVREHVYIADLYQEEGEEGLGFLLLRISDLRQFVARAAGDGMGAFAVIT